MRNALIYVWLAAGLLSGGPRWALSQEAESAQFEDPPAVLAPKRARTAAEQDRVTAAAMFAHGRLLFQREDYAGALRDYQRAWRLHSEAGTVLAEIVPLAFELNRSSEAARYAVIAAELDPRDTVLLRRLAIHLSEQKDWQRALKLYEKTVELDTNPEDDANHVLLRLEMGRLYFLTGDYRRSADSFAYVRNALASPEKYGLGPDLVKSVLGKAELTFALLAESFLQADRFDEALAMFRKSHEAKANAPMLAMQEARVLARRKQTDAALARLEEYFRAKTSDGGAEPYELLGQLLKTKLANDQQAAADLQARLERLYAEDLANAPLAYYLARVLREAEAWENAEKVLLAISKLEPSAEGFQGLAEIYQRQKRVPELLEVLGQTAAKTGSLEVLGPAEEALAKEADLVRQLIELARRRHAADPKSLAEGVPLGVGLLAAKAGEFAAADEFFELAIAASEPNKAEVMITWGLALFTADNFEGSAKVFRRAIAEKVVPATNPALHFYLAGALEMAGRTDEALSVAREAAALAPKNPRFQSRLPWILYHAKRYAEAEEKYEQLIRAFDNDHASPETRDVLREARLVLSNICVLQDKMPAAEEWLEQVLDEFPEDAGAMNDLGYLWADQNKNLERALVMVQKAVDEEPDNMAYRDSLGWALFRLGRYAEAIKELEIAAGKEDPDGVILDHLGDAYAKAGQKEQAVAAWRRAVTAFEKEQDTKRRLAAENKIKENSKE